jgi:flavorubredoxin
MQTRIDEIDDGIYRVSTTVPPSVVPGGFTFNQFLIVDEEPLLHHTGLRGLFPLVSEAIARVLPLERLRYVALSHFESDECGALNEFLQVAPRAVPVCSDIAAMVSVDDFACRPARGLQDGEELSLGQRRVKWISTPHLPHAWECGHLLETTTRTLFCGDLFTQGGDQHPPVSEADILGPSEAMRAGLDYFSHTRNAKGLIEKLAALRPTTLACMHGASWKGDGAALLRALGEALDPTT